MNTITDKFRFALDESSELIDAESLNEDSRKDYVCLGCNKIVRPVIGKIRKKHFRHKVKFLCNSETYLHHAAKWIIYKQYKKQLVTNQSYNIEFENALKCNLCVEGECDVESRIETYDLTKVFKKIDIEKQVDSFRPDLTLSSISGKEKVFIEIVVSHYSEDKKIDSGNRIVEIVIENENDLERLCIPKIGHSDNVQLINFSPKPKFVTSTKFCRSKRNCFILYESGKSIVKEILAYQISTLDKQGYRYFEIGNFDKSKCFFDGLKFVLEMQIEITNCFFCRYSTRNKFRYDSDQPVFCKFLKMGCQSNQAFDCKFYRRDNDVAFRNINTDG